MALRCKLQMKQSKILPYRLMAPGPVPLPSAVREALQRPALHHRTPDFENRIKECFEGLKTVFQTSNPVLIQSATGSGVMESAVVNTLSPGDEVICIVGGKFGERWAEICKNYGVVVHSLTLEWGEKLDLTLLESLLKKYPQVKAVLSQACETSTATVYPIQKISELVKKHSNALILVDAITAMGCMELPMDLWGLDVVIAGSQKAFMLPTGMGFIGVSKKALEFSKSSRIQKYYFDWNAELKNYPKTTRFSSPNSMIVALQQVLELFFKVGLDQVQKRCRTLQEATEVGCQSLGLKLFSKDPSSSVTAISLPKDVQGEKLRNWLESEKNITVMGGQDQLKGKILRIGHMGAITNEDMIQFFKFLCEGLELPEPIDLEVHIKKTLAQAPEYFL